MGCFPVLIAADYQLCEVPIVCLHIRLSEEECVSLFFRVVHIPACVGNHNFLSGRSGKSDLISHCVGSSPHQNLKLVECQWYLAYWHSVLCTLF